VNQNELIRVGLITKQRGLRGELSVMPLTGDPERFKRLEGVYVEMPAGGANAGRVGERDVNRFFNDIRSEKIASVRYHRGQVIVRFEGCDSAEAASMYRGAYISISEDQLVTLKKDSYFVFDLVGCSVFNTEGKYLGELVDVLETGSNDVYVVKPGLAPPKGNENLFSAADTHLAPGADIIAEDILIPALKTVILEVDIPNKRIVTAYEPAGQ
jgi:16S rRNA processing protein RimM